MWNPWLLAHQSSTIQSLCNTQICQQNIQSFRYINFINFWTIFFINKKKPIPTTLSKLIWYHSILIATEIWIHFELFNMHYFEFERETFLYGFVWLLISWWQLILCLIIYLLLNFCLKMLLRRNLFENYVHNDLSKVSLFCFLLCTSIPCSYFRCHFRC